VTPAETPSSGLPDMSKFLKMDDLNGLLKQVVGNMGDMEQLKNLKVGDLLGQITKAIEKSS